MSKNNRIEYLDSLRGLASVTVVIHHILLVMPLFFLAHQHYEMDNELINVLSQSALHIFWAGHEAVMLFFVLSGFVLALPFLNQKKTIFSKYLIKRVCRIYIPYIVSIIISILLFVIINPSSIDGMSDHFNNQWSHDISTFSLISYILLLGFDAFNINGVTWSLVHELRISILFPILMFYIIKLNWKKNLVLGIGISLSLWAILMIFASKMNIEIIRMLLVSFAETFYFASFFIIGAVLAKYRGQIISFVTPLKFLVKVLAFTIFIILYNIEWIFYEFGALKFNNSIVISKLATIIIDFTIVIGVVLLFSLVLSSKKLQFLLNQRPLIALGKVSYSLYLIHIPVLLSIVHLFYSSIPKTILLPLVFFSSILLAIIFYYLVEKPSIMLGKFLTKNVKTTENDIIEIKNRA